MNRWDMHSKDEPSPLRHRALLPVLVSLGMLVAVISSLGAPLVPTIAAAEQVSLGDAQWSLTITLLVGAVATPTMGHLGDGPHRRSVILGGLTAVVVGCALAALPSGFAGLLAGRALQGIGLGLTPLAIATARDALPAERAQPAMALLSITTVAGVGLGYPLTGLIAQFFGLHAGFLFGALVSVAALVPAAIVLPSTTHRWAPPLDVLGALLLGGALAGLLLVLSQAELWGWTSAPLLALAAGSVLLLGAWVAHELRTPHPLVDLRQLRHRTVLVADVTALVAGVGIYLLMSLVTRFVQTPPTVGYGFGASIVVAGLVLLPYSMASVAAGRLVPTGSHRMPLARALPVGCGISLLAIFVFAVARNDMWHIVVIMAIAGFGVGATFATMPGLIMAAVPAGETGSAFSFNQVLRYIGFSTGSALSATVLQAHTAAGAALPSAEGYTSAALLGCGVWMATTVLGPILLRSTTATGQPTPENVVSPPEKPRSRSARTFP